MLDLEVDPLTMLAHFAIPVAAPMLARIEGTRLGSMYLKNENARENSPQK